MHILPLLILASLLSCTASKKESKRAEQPLPSATPMYLPTQQGSPKPLRPAGARRPTQRHTQHEETGKVHTQREETGKVHTQHEDTGKVHTQHEDTGKAHTQHEDSGKEETGKEPPVALDEPEKPTEPEPGVLSVQLSFRTIDAVLYPWLEFSGPDQDKVRDIELSHVAATLKLEDSMYTLQAKGIELPPLQFWLTLTWRDSNCIEKIEVENMTKTMEVLCQ